MTATLPHLDFVTACGLDLAPDAGRWFAPPDDADLFALDGLDEPVLDVGCGPGRLVAHLAAAGVTALGVDVSLAAVERTRARGAPALHRSVFDPLPGTGRWGAAVLLDGNIGIGGDATALLGRIRELLRPGGRAVVEVHGPGTESRVTAARLTVDGDPTDWFPWSVVGTDAIDELGAAAGLEALSVRSSGDRWFANLHRS